MPSGGPEAARLREDNFEGEVAGSAVRNHWGVGHLNLVGVVRTSAALEGVAHRLGGSGDTAEGSVVRGSGHNFAHMPGCHKPVGHKLGRCYSDCLVHHPIPGARSRRVLDQQLACLGQNSPTLDQDHNKSPSV